mgnify:CR=1 FL=1
MSRNKLQLFPAFPGKHLIIHHHIQFPAKQYAVHAEIHPQHDEHDSGKASIHIENPLNISTYTENIQDTIIHPMAANTAPGSCLRSLSFLFGRNL